MLKNLLYIFILALMVSCIPDEPTIPDDIIPKDQMVEIMKEVQVIEAVRQRGVVLPKDFKPEKEAMKMYVRLFQKHNINDSVYKHSYAWYEDHPKLLAQIYDQVLVQLSEEQALARQNISSEKGKKADD